MKSGIGIWIGVFFAVVLASPSCILAQEPDVEMGRSSPANEDFLMESAPMKPHENVYIEDVEAQVREAHEEAKNAAREIKKTDNWIKRVQTKNYGDKKHLQLETLKALERKKKADNARLKVWVQREKLQKEILAYEKKRARAKDRARKAEESVETAGTKLTEAKQNRVAYGNTHKRPSTSMKRYRRVKVNFGEEQKSKKGVANAY